MIWEKFLVMVFIGIGESLMIMAQIFGAKTSLASSSFWAALKPSSWYLWVTLAAAIFILIGYFFGIRVFNNIWLVTLTSWTTIVIVEIAVNWLVFHTMPTGTVLAGFLLVVAGFVIANI